MAAAKALYASLRKHLGPAGAEKNVVPQKVYLYPIRYMKLDPMVALLKVIVSFGCFSLTVYFVHLRPVLWVPYYLFLAPPL